MQRTLRWALLAVLLLVGLGACRAAETPPSSSEPQFNYADFKKLVASGKPVFVDFWATWCGPCNEMKPIVHSLEPKWHGRGITFVPVNVDDVDGRKYAEEMQVDGIPRFLFYRDGKIVASSLGYQKAEELEKSLALIADGAPAAAGSPASGSPSPAAPAP